jgi:uncharacterized protein
MQFTPRSLLLGGLGLAGSIWLLDGITDVLGDWLPAIVLGSGATWAYLSFSRPSALLPISKMPLTADRVKVAIADVETIVNQLANEAPQDSQQVAKLRLQIHETLSGLDRKTLAVATMGSKAVGKTTLHRLLETEWQPARTITFRDTPELLSATTPDTEAWKLAKAADLVLFVTDGDLMASQLQALQRLVQGHRRTIVVFNKQDQYLPKEQTEVLQRIQASLTDLIASEDIVAIATAPRPIKVRQHQHDGSVKEWLEEPEPQITALTDRLTAILLQEGDKLVLASSLGDAEALKLETQTKLDQIRRTRATPLIDKAQWLVAGTTCVNPFPALDLLATAAINGQMVIELAAVYQKPMTLDQGKTIAKTIAALMVKQGIVEFSTQAIALLLKTNMVTYVAGGLMQGVSAAYLTRVAGFTLIEYFESGAPQSPDQIAQILGKVFQQNQRGAFLELFVKQVGDRLLTPQIETPAKADEPPQQVITLPSPAALNLPQPLPPLETPERVELLRE